MLIRGAKDPRPARATPREAEYGKPTGASATAQANRFEKVIGLGRSLLRSRLERCSNPPTGKEPLVTNVTLTGSLHRDPMLSGFGRNRVIPVSGHGKTTANANNQVASSQIDGLSVLNSSSEHTVNSTHHNVNNHGSDRRKRNERTLPHFPLRGDE
jgi:hypothetical protein